MIKKKLYCLEGYTIFRIVTLLTVHVLIHLPLDFQKKKRRKVKCVNIMVSENRKNQWWPQKIKRLFTILESLPAKTLLKAEKGSLFVNSIFARVCWLTGSVEVAPSQAHFLNTYYILHIRVQCACIRKAPDFEVHVVVYIHMYKITSANGDAVPYIFNKMSSK